MTSLVASLVTSLASPGDGEGEGGGLAELDNLKIGHMILKFHILLIFQVKVLKTI